MSITGKWNYLHTIKKISKMKINEHNEENLNTIKIGGGGNGTREIGE